MTDTDLVIGVILLIAIVLIIVAEFLHTDEVEIDHYSTFFGVFGVVLMVIGFTAMFIVTQ